MPKVKISEYSATANSNTDVASINIDEGCAPSGINNAIRAVMGHLKDFQSGTSNDPFTIGSSGSLTLSYGTANGVAYLNGSKVLTTGSALVFDGTNLGVGVTPSSWATYKAIDVLGYASFSSYNGNEADMSTNAYYNAGWKYKNTAAATLYQQDAGVHRWQYAASGTAGNAISFTQAMTLDASGNLGIGNTSPSTAIGGQKGIAINGGAASAQVRLQDTASGTAGSDGLLISFANPDAYLYNYEAGSLIFGTSNTERARIDSSGNLLVGKSGDTFSAVGGVIRAVGSASFTATNNEVLDLNRLSTDGKLLRFFQDTTEEGNISVSGTTVSYVGGHLSRYAQTTTAKDESLVKGTVLSNLDAMNVYTDAEGNLVDNEQLNKVKVSDAEGDANVAGVFVNWTHDDAHDVDEINMAMTGDMIIRIAQGVTVARGDLLMSAGDGTAKPQGDDIVRSKTVAKVTSTHITCTYPDGSFCVPCVLMAC